MTCGVNLNFDEATNLDQGVGENILQHILLTVQMTMYF